MRVIDGIAVFGDHAENTLAQARDVRSRAVAMALMADGHLGFIMPVGGVAAYDNQVSVSGVGYDIACGNCAIKTDMHIEDLTGGSFVGDSDVLSLVANDIAKHISFGMGRTNLADDAPTDHPLFDSLAWDRLGYRIKNSEMEKLRQKARNQLGTVGSGNHYVDVFADEDGWIWVGVHFGSRGLGHSIATGFMNLAHTGKWDGRVPEQETLLNLGYELGDTYWACMELAGQYAYAGREWVCSKVVSMLGAREVEMVHNHHNFAWKEVHKIGNVVVVRKGATPAFAGQRGFVGGSMGDNAVILAGNDPIDIFSGTREEVDAKLDAAAWLEDAQASLFSTVHGAGRVMSRTQAAGKTKWGPEKWHCRNYRNCDFKGDRGGFHKVEGGPTPKCPNCGHKLELRRTSSVVKEGAISQEEMNQWVNGMGVILRGGGRDEAPQAYRRLPDVLAAQGDTVKVLHTLRPLIVVMAGADEFDPYKD